MTLKSLAKEIKIQNKKLNLLSSGDVKKLEKKHFADSLEVMKFWKLEKDAKVMDLGTGGGLPGLVLAIKNPKMDFVLVDSIKKKVSALKTMIKNLKLKNVHAVLGRAEVLGHEKKYRSRFDAVTARALAPLPTLLEYCTPFLKTGGKIYAWKSSTFEEELKNSEHAIKELGLKLEKKHKYKIPDVKDRVIACFVKEKETDLKYCRETGVPLKRPL